MQIWESLMSKTLSRIISYLFWLIPIFFRSNIIRTNRFIDTKFIYVISTLQWRHNERDGVSNRRRLYCLLSRFFRRISKKASKFHATGLYEGIHRWPVDSPHQGSVTRKMFPLDDIIILCWFRLSSFKLQLIYVCAFLWISKKIKVPSFQGSNSNHIDSNRHLSSRCSIFLADMLSCAYISKYVAV